MFRRESKIPRRASVFLISYPANLISLNILDQRFGRLFRTGFIQDCFFSQRLIIGYEIYYKTYFLMFIVKMMLCFPVVGMRGFEPLPSAM